MATLTEQLVDFILATPYEALPADLVTRMQSYVLDLIGVTLVGMDQTSSQIMLKTVLADGGHAQATVMGVGKVAPMGNAALINGTAAHAVEMDDDHRLGTVHVGAVVIPAALAAAEGVGCDGKTFIRAITMGYEVMCRIGEALLGRQFYAGFHPTSSCGVFGAATAAAVILGLDQAQFVNALGIAGTQSFGLGEWRADGSWIKRFHPGRSAQSGVLAARLACEGFTGPATILEGQNGWLQAFSYQKQWDANLITRDLGTKYTAVLTAFKPYPGCRFAHTALDLGYDFYHVDGIKADDIESAAVRVYKTDILNYAHRPSSAVIAQFCVPYLLSTMLSRGKLSLQDLTPEAIQDEAILALADKIDVTEDDAFTAAYPERYITDVKLKLKSGREVSRISEIPRGDPDAAEYQHAPGLFERQVEDKFRTLMTESPYADRIDGIIQAVNALPQAANLDRLAQWIGSGVKAS
ncbi:MAG: MmgE/PrpD family protein [Anaerolineae bacterium]|nr:MmgE/PrpD family protein [Anaerolineae bacterium]